MGGEVDLQSIGDGRAVKGCPSSWPANVHIISVSSAQLHSHRRPPWTSPASSTRPTTPSASLPAPGPSLSPSSSRCPTPQTAPRICDRRRPPRVRRRPFQSPTVLFPSVRFHVLCFSSCGSLLLPPLSTVVICEAREGVSHARARRVFPL